MAALNQLEATLRRAAARYGQRHECEPVRLRQCLWRWASGHGPADPGSTPGDRLARRLLPSRRMLLTDEGPCRRRLNLNRLLAFPGPIAVQGALIESLRDDGGGWSGATTAQSGVALSVTYRPIRILLRRSPTGRARTPGTAFGSR